MNKQIDKLNKPVDKFSFQQLFTETEFFPVDNFMSRSDNTQNINDSEKTLDEKITTITKPDSGFQEGYSTSFVDNTQTPFKCFQFADPPDIRVSPVRTQPRVQSSEVNPKSSDDQRSSRVDRRISGRLKTSLLLAIKQDLLKSYLISLV